MKLPAALHERLMVNAGALMVSSVVTGVLGLIYWIVAGRLFDPSDVGRASALISTSTMLASIACLSLGGAYQRFLPLAGRRSVAALLGGLGLTAVTGLVLGAAFAWSPMADRLLHDTTGRLLFPVMVVIFGVFALTDAILTGLRLAPSVAMKNISASVLKIIPLLLLSAGVAATGIVVSWTGVSLVVGAAFVVIALRAAARRRGPSALPPARELLSFQGAFLAMMLVSSATPLVLPLLVVNRLGTAENAYFNLAWTMCTATGLLRAAAASAFIVEASAPGADRPALLRRILPVYGGVALLTAAGLAIAGPMVLAAAGPEYLRAAWPLMLIMAVAALGECVVTGYYTVAQLVRRLRPMVVSQILIVCVTIGGSYLLIPVLGLTAVGLSTAGALVVALMTVMMPLRRGLSELSRPITGVSAEPAEPQPLFDR